MAILNLIKDQSGVTEAEVYDFLRRDEFVRMETERMHLSHKGEEVFEEVAQVQETINEKSMQNESAEAYSITMETLQKIMNNLQEFLP